MKQLIFWGIFTFANQFLFSQNNTVTTGGDINGSNGSVSYSIGQIDYISTINSNGSVNQGNQQPYEFYSSVGLNEVSNIVAIFPNPTVNAIQIQLSNFSGLSYQLVDAKGKLIEENSFNTEFTTIDMSQLSSANYFLQIIKDGEKIETTIIIKN